MEPLYKYPHLIQCIKCGKEFEPGLNNLIKHWMDCDKNLILKKILGPKTFKEKIEKIVNINHGNKT